jgi:hypothetical protein
MNKDKLYGILVWTGIVIAYMALSTMDYYNIIGVM